MRAKGDPPHTTRRKGDKRLRCSRCSRLMPEPVRGKMVCLTCGAPHKCPCSRKCDAYTWGEYATGHYPRTEEMNEATRQGVLALGERHPMRDPDTAKKAGRRAKATLAKRSPKLKAEHYRKRVAGLQAFLAENGEAHSKKLSIAQKKRWENMSPEEREAFSIAQSEGHRRPEVQAKMSLRMLEVWSDRSDPRIKSRVRNIRKAWKSKELRAAQSRRFHSHGYKQTAPERVVEIKLKKHGFRYTGTTPASKTKTPISADFVHKSLQILVQVDGCFWHCCPKHGKEPTGPFAKERRKRDRALTRYAEKRGWAVLRFWEHDVMHNIDKVEKIAAECVNSLKKVNS